MIFNGKPLSLPMAENRLNYEKKISNMVFVTDKLHISWMCQQE